MNRQSIFDWRFSITVSALPLPDVKDFFAVACYVVIGGNRRLSCFSPLSIFSCTDWLHQTYRASRNGLVTGQNQRDVLSLHWTSGRVRFCQLGWNRVNNRTNHMNRIEISGLQYPTMKGVSAENESSQPVTLVNVAAGEVSQRSWPGKRLGKRKSCVSSKGVPGKDMSGKERVISCPCNREHATDECPLPAKRTKKAELEVVDSKGNTPLCLAVRAGLFARARQLIEAGADVLHVNNDGNNVLLLAAQNGHLQFLDWSELGDVNLHHVNSHGNNALMLAAANGHYDSVRWLTVMGIDSRQQNEDGDNVLTLAAVAGHWEVVEWLLDGATGYTNEPIEVNKANHQGNTALMLAAANGHLYTVQLLVACGGTVVGFNRQQADAMALAVLGGHLETVQWLSTRQINIHQCYWDKSNLFHFAAVGGDLATAQWLRHMSVCSDQPNSGGLTALSLAAQHGHLELVTWLLAEKLSSIDQLSLQGDSPTLLAARNGHLVVVQLLIANGQAINQSNMSGQSALTLAARSCEPLALWLCHHGADIHHVDGKGNSAFLLGAKSGFVDLLQYLEQQGADIHLVNNQGDNAFTLAAKSGSEVLLRWLHEKQINIHQVNQRHGNALTRAACAGSLPVVELLCSLGVDHSQCVQAVSDEDDSLSFSLHALALAVIHGHLDLADRLSQNCLLEQNDYGPLLLAAENGQLAAIQWWYRQIIGPEDLVLHGLYPQLNTALLLAAAKGHLPVMRWLYLHGASVNAQTHSGDTVLLLAVKCGDLTVVKWLYQHGADLHSVNHAGNNALSMAAMGGDLTMVRWLMSKEVVNCRNSEGCDALALAVQNGDVSVTRWLALSQDVHQCDHWGNNLFLLALCHGHVQLGIWLGHRGVDIHRVNQDGDNALLLAAGQGDLSAVIWLCEQNVDEHWVNYAGNNALMCAAAAGHLPVVRWLYEYQEVAIGRCNSDGCNALDLAAMNGHLHVVLWLEGKPVTLSAAGAENAILSAAQRGQVPLLQWFQLRHYPFENGQDSVFLRAVASNNLPLVDWCLEQGYCTPLLASDGKSCFTMACVNGNLPLLQRLCQRLGGVAVADAIPGVGQSMLAAAARSGSLHIMQWLATQGINPLLRQPGDIIKPIFFAIDHGHLHIAKWLRNLGANLNHQSDDGHTVLTTAICSGHLTEVKWLCQQGMALHDVDLHGLDALSLAIDGNHGEMALWMMRQGCALTVDHVDVASLAGRKQLLRVLYQALSSAGRAVFMSGLDINQKRWLLRVLNINYVKKPSEEQILAAIARYDALAGDSLKQRSLQVIARIIRNKHPSWAAASDGVSRLPLLPIIKSELRELLETRFFP